MLEYDQLVPTLLKTIPELKLPYKQQLKVSSGAERGPHIVFGDVLTPYLISLLESGERNDLVERIFAFLEELAMHPDELIQEVVAQSVCERLTDRKEWLARARKYMGPKTLAFVRQAGSTWGIEYAKKLR